MITLAYTRLRSLTQDGTVLNEVSNDGPEILTGGVNSASERKKLYARFEIEDAGELAEQMSLSNAKLYVSFALFLPSGLAVDFANGIPNTGFSITLPSTYYEMDDNPVEMPFYSLVGGTPKSAKNYKCYFTWITDSSFAVELEYYNTFDEDGYMNGAGKSNQWRFFSEYIDQNNTNEVSESVYGVEKELRMISHLVREDLTDDGFKYTETQEHRLYSGTISRIDSVGQFLDIDEEEIASLSSVSETPLIVRIYTTENTIDKFYAKLVKIKEDSSLDFIENYELMETFIDAGAAPTESENAFIAPCDLSRDDAEGFYQLEFSVNPDFIEDGVMYRIIIVAYDQGGDAYSGALNRTTTSPPIPGSSIATYCNSPCSSLASYDYPTTLLFTPSLFDIDKEYTGNFLTCCIEERMRSQLIVDYSDNRWKNNIDCRKTGSVGGDTANTNDIRKHLQSIEFEIYQESFSTYFGGTIKHVHDQQSIGKIGMNNYSASSTNLVFTFDPVNETLTLTYDWRNRNESNIPNIITFFNGLQALNIDNQYWGGKSFFIKWRLNFYYYDFAKPFTESLDIIQKMVVKDYSTDVVITNGFDLDFVCPEETICFDAAIIKTNPELYRLINTFQLTPGSISEEENWTPGELAQQANAYIYGQDVDYTSGNAVFCLNPSTLNINQSYTYSAMAKKI